MGLGAPTLITAQPDGGGVRLTLDRKTLDWLTALRGPGESYSDVILRLAKPYLNRDCGPSSAPSSTSSIAIARYITRRRTYTPPNSRVKTLI